MRRMPRRTNNAVAGTCATAGEMKGSEGRGSKTPGTGAGAAWPTSDAVLPFSNICEGQSCRATGDWCLGQHACAGVKQASAGHRATTLTSKTTIAMLAIARIEIPF